MVKNAAPSEKQRATQTATQVQKQNLIADIGDMPNKCPSTKFEIQDKHTEYSARFLNPDGSFTEEVYAQAKFYKDPTEKKWKNIDNNLKPNAEGKSISLVPVQGNSIKGIVKNNEITYINLDLIQR